MQFANPHEARDFLERHPDVRSIELMLIDLSLIHISEPTRPY